MCYPLNGSDLSPERSPIEAALGFFVDLEKPDFIGRAVLVRHKADGVAVKLTALQYSDKGPPPRAHYPVLAEDGTVIGELSSGALSPTLRIGIGLAYLPIAYSKPGTPLQVDVRGRQFPATVVKKPFYKK
jgi:aminomethyltransferase